MASLWNTERSFVEFEGAIMLGVNFYESKPKSNYIKLRLAYDFPSDYILMTTISGNDSRTQKMWKVHPTNEFEKEERDFYLERNWQKHWFSY